jgi:hypothetical protein
MHGATIKILTVEFAVDLGRCLRNGTSKKWVPVERMSGSDRD